METNWDILRYIEIYWDILRSTNWSCFSSTGCHIPQLQWLLLILRAFEPEMGEVQRHFVWKPSLKTRDRFGKRPVTFGMYALWQILAFTSTRWRFPYNRGTQKKIIQPCLWWENHWFGDLHPSRTCKELNIHLLVLFGGTWNIPKTVDPEFSPKPSNVERSR